MKEESGNNDFFNFKNLFNILKNFLHNNFIKSTVFIWITAVLFFSTSCNVSDEVCRKEKNSRLKVGFYTAILNSSTGNYTLSTLSIDSLTVNGVDSLGNIMDSVLYNNSKNLSSIKLPLNKFSNESKFIIRFNDSIQDTLTVFHTNYDQYLSFECGIIRNHLIDTVLITNHFVDSVKIEEHNVSTIDAEHLQIFHN